MTPEVATLRVHVGNALTEAERILASPGPRPELAGARHALDENRARWDGRMRVALVGRVSSGKSTLINALLGADLAATGRHELTRVVTWLRHAEAPMLTVTYKDAARGVVPVDPPTLAALAELTTHKDGDFADDVDYVTYRIPNPQLTAFDLIDTPGLDSAQGIDSANTVRHLGPREDTADAIVLVFARGISTQDTDAIARFQRTAAAEGTEVSPLTTVGVLTQVEHDWRPGQALMEGDRLAVLAQGERTARGLMSDAGAGRMVYDIYPLASKIAAAAGTFTEADFTALEQLAAGKVRPEDLADYRKWRRNGIPGVPVNADHRQALFERFTACGILVACHLISNGVGNPGELRQQLNDISGMTRFRRLLAEHFRERGDLIKADRLIKRTRAAEERHRISVSSARSLDVLYQATDAITSLADTQIAFRERGALRAYYDRKLQLDQAEAAEMLRVFGESPGSGLVADRLGLPAAPPRQLVRYAAERSAHWRERSERGAFNSDTREACHVLSRSYDHLAALITAHDLLQRHQCVSR